MIERTREDGRQTDDVRVTGPPTPDITAPLTWRQCIAEGCDTRVDPRDQSTRCPTHRTELVDLERIREIVEVNRRAAAHVAGLRAYARAVRDDG
jgi:hypothetical protein